jgi:hypothetical protein
MPDVPGMDELREYAVLLALCGSSSLVHVWCLVLTSG